MAERRKGWKKSEIQEGRANREEILEGGGRMIKEGMEGKSSRKEDNGSEGRRVKYRKEGRPGRKY